MQVENVTLGIDQCAGRRELLQQGLLGHLTQGVLPRGEGFFGGHGQYAVAVVVVFCGGYWMQGIRHKALQHSAPGTLKVFRALVNFCFAVQHPEQAAKLAHGLGRA